MAFVLPFENQIHKLDERLAALPEQDPAYAKCRAELQALESRVYPNLSPYDTFLLSGHPLRPKALDYIRYIFDDVRLFYNPQVRGDHLVVGGQGKLEIDGRLVNVMIVGQQTGPSCGREELLKLPISEYQRWNQGMGFPDGYRKAVHLMDLAEQRGWPVVVLVDTPGADPHEFSEEEGQAFAINEVIHKTTALRVPNLSYIISLGASGGAIAVTPTNRTIMNEYATYMVISPGGCASILFRNRSPDSIRQAAEGLRLTSADAVQQETVDDVIEEGLHPGHRYPQELLAKAKDAVVRNLRELIGLRGAEAERVRREKFCAMGVWDETGDDRPADALAQLASQQNHAYARLEKALAKYISRQNRKIAESNRKPLDQTTLLARLESRLNMARLIYAIEKGDAKHLCHVLAFKDLLLTRTQWVQIREFALARRYGNMDGADTLHPHGGVAPYRRLHPVDWICRLTDDRSFHEFEQTVRHCSVVQLGFPEYEEALDRGIRNTGLHSGLITGTARIGGYDAVLAINNFGLVGSSLCDEIGEKFRFAAHHALKTETPLISVAMGGGARMQEGTPSMHRNIPKAQHALNELEEAGVPHISIVADPTLGGTAISYGLRGDLMIVVQGSANIGFSGKRVVEQFQQRKVGRDFQHGTWLLERGFVDEVVATDDMARRLAELLKYHAEGGRLADLQTRRPRPWKPTEQVPLDATPTPHRLAV
ncbi:MAG TPA: carboxyl transferase domain-containing protein [Phycisphaerae bacterium]|nr:carboxyl transferase domain-containing protein [Phycisphaerae bacterium]